MIAASKIPVCPADRIKTDRLDSVKLAEYYKRGMLTIVRDMDEETQGYRHLIRGRNQAVHACKICKQQILSACRYYGMSYLTSTQSKSYWTQRHLAFLNGLLKDDSLDRYFRMDLENKLYVLQTYQGMIKKYEAQIHQLEMSEPYRKLVGY